MIPSDLVDDGVLMAVAEQQIDWISQKSDISRGAGRLALLSVLMHVREECAKAMPDPGARDGAEGLRAAGVSPPAAAEESASAPVADPHRLLRAMLVHLLHAMEGGRYVAVNVPNADADGQLVGFDRFTVEDVQTELARLRTEPASPARATYVGERPGRCDICDRERARTTIVDAQRICDDCFYRLRDVPKP